MEIVAVIVAVVLLIGWRNRQSSQAAPRIVVETVPRRTRPATGTASRAARPAIRFDASHQPTDVGPDAAGRGDAFWRRAAVGLEVHGRPLGAGLVYFGQGLTALSGGRPEPALIDPKLALDRKRIDWAGDGLDYWPSYSRLPPASRAAYVAWLEEGRPTRELPVGYAFLFFYGLERRVLVDARHLPAAAAEVPVIRAEVERLLATYSSNHSFRSYATDFLGAIDLLWPNSAAPRPLPARSWELPLELRVRIGRTVAAAEPLPAGLAFEWLMAAPEINLRTPATRCAAEFRRLFEVRYATAFGEGLRIRPPRRRLSAHYRPASASFGGPIELPVGDLPDVAGLTAPVNQLRQLADACSDELDAYSRWIGRNPDGAQSLAAAALLPPELVGGQQGVALADLRAWLNTQLDGRAAVAVPARDLLRHWPTASGWQPTRAESVSLAQLLAKLGVGIEPDVRFDGPVIGPSSEIVLYPLTPAEAAAAPTSEYALATLVAHLGMAVAAADGAVSDDELARLDTHLSGALRLDAHEHNRLAAHMRWLRVGAPPLSGMKKRIAALNPTQRDDLGDFLVAVAAADGMIGPTEVASLEKMFTLLGLDRNLVFGRVHAFTTGTGGQSKSSAGATSGGAGPLVLDMTRVEAKLRETQAVSALLGGVFAGDDGAPPAAEPPAAQAPAALVNIQGLDGQHSALLRVLRGRDSVARAELETLAREHRLLPDGAIDTINDAAFDAVGHPVIEGDDPLLVDTDALEDMIA